MVRGSRLERLWARHHAQLFHMVCIHTVYTGMSALGATGRGWGGFKRGIWWQALFNVLYNRTGCLLSSHSDRYLRSAPIHNNRKQTQSRASWNLCELRKVVILACGSAYDTLLEYMCRRLPSRFANLICWQPASSSTRNFFPCTWGNGTTKTTRTLFRNFNFGRELHSSSFLSSTDSSQCLGDIRYDRLLSKPLPCVSQLHS